MKHALPKDAKKVLATLKKAGFEAYAVGGCVRDIILGRETKDWDFTTSAKPDQIRKLFPDSYYDNKFGTVGVPVRKSPKDEPEALYEITTFRSEQGYSDHRHPDQIVWGEKLEDDLKRRDFTVNALAYEGEKIIDPFDGQTDLQKRTLRAVGNHVERFREDALRLMRAVRFSTELQFIIEEETFEAIKNNASLIKNISSERIRDELFKILASP